MWFASFPSILVASLTVLENLSATPERANATHGMRSIQWRWWTRERWRWFQNPHFQFTEWKVKDLSQGLTTLVTGRKKSSWRSYGRCWNCIPHVKVFVVGFEIVNLQFLLITLTTSSNAGRKGLEKLYATVYITGRGRFQLPDRLFRLRHGRLLWHLCLELI